MVIDAHTRPLDLKEVLPRSPSDLSNKTYCGSNSYAAHEERSRVSAIGWNAIKRTAKFSHSSEILGILVLLKIAIVVDNHSR
jgi:hypothetical protein